MTLKQKTQLTGSRARKARGRAVAGAAAAGRRGRRAAVAAGRRGRSAAQAAPMSAAARMGRHGVLRARGWAAPRLDRTGQALENQVAPRLAAMLSATARRIEPVPPRRRRWPLVAGGLVAAAGLSATAAFLLSRRSEPVPMSQPAEPFRPATPGGRHEAAHEPAGSDVNGRVRTP